MVQKIRLISIVSALFLIVSCNSEKPSKEDKLNDLASFFKDELHLKSSPERIFFISDKSCASCNKSFLTLAEEIYGLNNKRDYFIIGASGMILDISYFIDHKDRVYHIKRHFTKKWQIPKSSSVIYLKGNKIDSIITISATNIKNQLDLIRK